MRIDEEADGKLAGAITRIPVDSYEIEREAVIAMLERERRSLTSSLLALSLLAFAVAMLPDPAPMALLLALRFASFLFTRSAASRLEKRVRARKPLKASRRILFGGMSLTGVTLALMLWPQPPGASMVAVALIQIVVVVAVTLISVTLAALPASRDAMLASFWATASGLVLFHPAGLDPAMIAVVTLSVVGIRIYSYNTGHHIRSSARVLVENRRLSEDLADALAHAEFLSWRDPLTGLYNRRKLFEETRTENSPHSRHLLTIDLDRFKAINDTHGHGVGDLVLQKIAGAGRSCLRDQDLFGRLGGEEFLVILPGADAELAAKVAERLRHAVHELSGDSELGLDRLTVSLGVAMHQTGADESFFLQAADAALYQSKADGRNRLTVAQADAA